MLDSFWCLQKKRDERQEIEGLLFVDLEEVKFFQTSKKSRDASRHRVATQFDVILFFTRHKRDAVTLFTTSRP